jgi:hypothetical protein
MKNWYKLRYSLSVTGYGVIVRAIDVDVLGDDLEDAIFNARFQLTKMFQLAETKHELTLTGVRQ